MQRTFCIFVSLVISFLTVGIARAQVTLAQETANNTSACTLDAQHAYCSSAFAALEDKDDITYTGNPLETIYPDPAPGHVSNVSLSSSVAPTLMYSGFNGQFICEYQAWFGLSSHINVGYDETNSATTDAQAKAMKAAGCNVALVSFYGTTETNSDFTFELTATGTLHTSVEGISGVKFGILEVDQGFSGSTVTTGSTTGNCNQYGSGTTTEVTETINCIVASMEQDLNYITTNYVPSAYWEDGSPTAKPVLAFFGSVCDFAALSYGDPPADCHTAGPGPNALANWNTAWSAIDAAFSNFEFIFQYGAFARPTISAGEFAWPQPVTWDHNNGSLATGSQYWWCDPAGINCSGGYLETFYSDGISHSSAVTIGLLQKGFDDSNASWGTAPYRVTSQRCGQLVLNDASMVSNYFGSGGGKPQIPYVQVATWNDYEEGTEIETGISNCQSFSGISVNTTSNTLNWTLSSSDLYGYATTNTIHHYTLWYAGVDDPSQTLHQAVTGIAGTATSINLNTVTWPTPKPNNLNLYLEMVGMPLVLNQMSPAVLY